MALFKILRGSIKNLPKTKTEGYMYITEDVGDIYVDMSNSKRIRLNAEAAEKIRKITYNSDGSYKSEVSFDYDDIAALQEANAAIRGELQNKAPHKAGVYFVKGTGTTEGTWLGTSSDITEYYDGLTVAYEVGIAGASTTTLNINGLGAKTCYRYGTSKITTQHPVGSVILLVYSATKNAWYATDYDSNTNTQVRLYKDETGTYPIIGSRTAAGSVTSGSTAVYGEISGTNAITMTPSSGTITATTFSGNASTATKLATARTIRTNLGSTSTASFDGSGNITPGVTGTLPIANGGTGATTAAGALTNFGLTATAAELNKLDGVTATTTELNYVDGVTSNIQTQLDKKLSTSGGALTGDITFTNASAKFLYPNNTDKTAIYISGGTEGQYGYAIQYGGSGSGNNNTLSIITDNQTGDKVTAVTMKQDGTTTFTKKITASGGITGNLTGNADTATKSTKSTVTKTNSSSGTTYNLPFVTSTGDVGLLANDGIGYWTKEGTTSTNGVGELKLGNNIVSGTAGNKIGMIYMYGTSSGYTEIKPSNNTTSNVVINLPSTAGTLALTSSDITGNSATATKLATARTIRTNLASTSTASFDGSGNITPGVTGTLPIANGGTGATTAAAALTNLGLTATAAELNKLDGVTATTTELNYVDGVTSAIQTQLNGKQASITGAATTITGSNLTASRALISNSSGKVAVSAVTSTELGYLDGVTSAIQTQLNGKLSTSGGSLSGAITINKTTADKTNPTSQDLVLNYSLPSGGTLTEKNAPGIGFHIGNVNWASLIYDGTFKFVNNNFTGYAPVKASKFIGSLQGNADTATKATQDGSGNTITSTYLNKTTSTAQRIAAAVTFNSTTASSSKTTGAVIVKGGVGVSGSIYGNKVYGAVWNDYAEYRQGTSEFEAGRVVCENGDDTLSLASERLQPGANIVSDTFGFAIGETEKAKTPLAVSGRVLAYPYEDRESYKPGDAVCAAPNGTVSKMTREEIREYPERIIGTVSAVPTYETWGENNVSVNGRIWIKVK